MRKILRKCEYGVNYYKGFLTIKLKKQNKFRISLKNL
jgi:hypothetical protein